MFLIYRLYFLVNYIFYVHIYHIYIIYKDIEINTDSKKIMSWKTIITNCYILFIIINNTITIHARESVHANSINVNDVKEEATKEEQKDPYNYFDPLTMKRATAHQNEALRVAAYKGNVDLVKHALEGNHLHHDIHHGTVHGVGAGPWANHGDIYYNRNYHDPFTTQYTALHAAALSGNFDLCELLMKHGWSVDAKTREGAKPSEIARRGGNNDLMSELKEKETPEPVRNEYEL